MGAAAALIPGIVGIAGGEYAGYKNRQKEAVDRADMGQFAKSLVESEQGPDPRLGGDVPNPMISANQLRARAAQRFPSYGEQVIKQDLEIRGRKQDAVSKEERDILAWMALHPGSNRIDAITGLSAATRGPSATKNPMASYDTKTGRPAFVTPEQIAAEPDRYTPPPSGMSLAIGPDGQVMFTQGGGGKNADPFRLTTPNTTAAQTAIMQTNDALARIGSIGSKFKPEYLELGTRWGNMASAMKEKAGFQISEVDKKNLSDYTSFARDALANLNRTIKELTGATIGQDEVKRLMGEMPVLGTGLLDGDAPTQFKRKTDDIVITLNSAKARQYHALQKGLSKEAMFAVPLEAIPDIIRARGDEILADLTKSNPGVEPEAIKQMVKDRLRMEYDLQ